MKISSVGVLGSGGDANDTQYKLFTYLNNAIGKPNKKKFLSRKKGYHGITVAYRLYLTLEFEPLTRGHPSELCRYR